jgi:polysaccharide pyruvyl transferase CsaB
MESMGSIVVSGYYGFDNAGDEAVLYSIIKTLKEEVGEHVKITVLSNKPHETASTYHVEAVNRWKYKEIIAAIKNADVLISGGGSLLQDVTGWKSIVYYLSIVMIAKFFRKKVIFYAQGIGPVNMKFNRLLIGWIADKVDYISVRDQQSKEELIKMGVKREIEVVADPVLKLNPKERQKDTKKRLGVYLRPWKVEEHFFDKIKGILNWFDQKGWEIIFIPMHDPEDVELSQKICASLPGSVVYDGEHDPQSILDFTATLDYVLGMRLHSLIMAAAAGVPYMGISYDPKVKSFVEAMEAGKVIDIYELDQDKAIHYLESTLNHLDEMKETIKTRRNQLLEQRNMAVEVIKNSIL